MRHGDTAALVARWRGRAVSVERLDGLARLLQRPPELARELRRRCPHLRVGHAQVAELDPVEALCQLPHGDVAAAAHVGKDRPDLLDGPFGTEIGPGKVEQCVGRQPAQVEDPEHPRSVAKRSTGPRRPRGARRARGIGKDGPMAPDRSEISSIASLLAQLTRASSRWERRPPRDATTRWPRSCSGSSARSTARGAGWSASSRPVVSPRRWRNVVSPGSPRPRGPCGATCRPRAPGLSSLGSRTGRRRRARTRNSAVGAPRRRRVRAGSGAG